VGDEESQDPWNAQSTVPPPHGSRHGSAEPTDTIRTPSPARTTAQRAFVGAVGAWWARVPFTPKIIAITAGLLVLCWGGFGLVGLFTDVPTSRARAPSDDVGTYAEEMPETYAVPPADTTGTEMPFAGSASPTGPGAPTTVPGAPTTGPGATATGPAVFAAPATSHEPVVETRTVTETESIPYDTQTVKDNSLPKGTQAVVTSGVPGVRTLTYELTLIDGVQTSKVLVQSAVTQDPVTEVIAIGTKPDSRCDPNYSGCVPIASDVDCAGDGDGPAYVYAPVDVIGTDIYSLDPDGNRIACG
jgi:resuscitation-promoting factor RpfB